MKEPWTLDSGKLMCFRPITQECIVKATVPKRCELQAFDVKAANNLNANLSIMVKRQLKLYCICCLGYLTHCRHMEYYKYQCNTI